MKVMYKSLQKKKIYFLISSSQCILLLPTIKMNNENSRVLAQHGPLHPRLLALSLLKEKKKQNPQKRFTK